MAKRAAEQGSFFPRTPPKSGFSIRAFVERRQQNPFVPRTPPKPGFSIRAFVERQQQRRENCAVCLETSPRTEFKTLGCNHRFHGDCLEAMLKNGQRTCPLCRANINDSWLEEQQITFTSNPSFLVVDELVFDMRVEYISDDDDEYYRYGREYYGSEIHSSDFDDMMTVIDSDIHNNYLAELRERQNDVFNLLDLGLQRLFDESNLSNSERARADSEERAQFLRDMNSVRSR